MSYLSNILLLIFSRGVALASFFLLSEVMSKVDFKSYALYFAAWQFISQFLSMQVGTTFFRCGIKKSFTRRIDNVLTLFYPIIIISLLATLLTINFNSIILPAIFMSVIGAIFVVISEYARAKINERIVFIVYMLPGLSYLLLFGVATLTGTNVTLHLLLYVETIIYAFISSFLLLSCSVQIVGGYRGIASSIKKIIPFWVRISLPLIPNNLLWYFYFNGPVIIGYQFIKNVEDFNNMALLFRFIVAISTVSSMLALVFQKKIVYIYELNKIKYLKIKRAFVISFLPLFLGLCICSYITILVLKSWFILNLNCLVCNIVIVNGGVLTFLFFMFLSIYLMSYYFVAEKDLRVISPSMIIGFILYVIAILAGAFYGLDFGNTSIYALCISLGVTFTIRYIWLFKQSQTQEA